MQEASNTLRRELAVVTKSRSAIMVSTSMLEQIGSVSTQLIKQVACGLLLACQTRWNAFFEPRPVQIEQC